MQVFASLSFEQVGIPLGIHRGFVEAVAPIEPVTIVDASGSRGFNMAFDFGVGVNTEIAGAICCFLGFQ
jgi:hypothetical protein